ncbi:potassium-transporting ATPase subunit KdpC [Cellvibrio mixtus]|uniref:potassium-transporting ATPase subunit KdpC n=1 Tax=Cellvibrio mixtus TaxID=39650 RepID=UPI000694D935|nr:potassium-transporting ATPase subunit KdpC [Cellvibrio mixtus]
MSVLRPTLALFFLLTLLCGGVYPYLITGVGQLAFSNQSQGSLVNRDGKVVGSALIGQSFTSPHYFWGRPSATGPMANNAGASSGSNQGPLNPALIDAVTRRIETLRAVDPGNTLPIPVDLVTASASGLDPDISLAAAHYQIHRIARARELDESRVQQLIEAHQQQPWLGFLGEPRVNVLALNLALDELKN